MLIQAALNGARTREEHPALPITPEEMAVAARECVTAGARAIHVHARGPDGRESLAAADVARAVTAIRAAVAAGVPIGVSTGAWIVPDADARLRAVAAWTTLPDFASVNFDEDGAEALADHLLSRGVGVEAGLSSVAAAERLAASGLAPRCLRALLEPDEDDVDAALGTVASLERALDAARIALPRLLHGRDATAWRLVSAAAARCYDTRAGFEDTLTLPGGLLAPRNADLVAEARLRSSGPSAVCQ